MKSFRLFAVAAAIVVSTTIVGTVHAAETPRFTAPAMGQTYTDIPDVRWTSPNTASEHQVFVMCYGCLEGASFLPLTYRFTVHQSYLAFSYGELKDFLRRHKITPDERVRVRLYVRSKVDGSFTKWSAPMEFFAKDDLSETDTQPVHAKIYPRENRDGSVTFFNYTERHTIANVIEIYINGQVVARCYNTYYCPYRHASQESVRYAVRTIHDGEIYFSEYRTYTPTTVSHSGVEVDTQISQTVYQGNNVVMLRATTKNNTIVDRLNILVNAKLGKECNNTNVCVAYISRDQLGETFTYGVNSYLNGNRYWSGYKGKRI